ncbi:CGNR zinc finger domain-containing protein [Leifsonia sp. F6_8S_P_1B]|uniref:CGNR zinc finger domain-containing protein n=1 Tax=Leifsonia williamsii TaxID=3035919 RepID=A0ABT8KCK1_9MICO|nr:CGNR zinc finger domain-containing protein [Leifsonia williamsii]MDN4615195.1 CGNR zinc finger domain-containing protein [Leifsonia williamsii]
MQTNAPAGAPAVGPDLLVDFLNTLDVEDGTDQLAEAASFRTWADAHGLEPGEREEARRVRDALRTLVDGGQGSLPGMSLPVTAAAGGLAPAATTVAEAAVASALVLSIQGRLSRVKLCGGEDCRWAFYDASRNGSRQWCSMEVCGNRQKARTFRARKQSGD